MQSRGRFDEAMAIALSLSRLEVDPERLGSKGASMLMWEARTLPARLYIARGDRGDFSKAIATLPGKGDPFLEKVKERTLSVFYLECIMQYLECRRALEEQKIDQAEQKALALGSIQERMEALKSQAMKSASLSEYVRALSGVKVYTAEVRGLVALARATSNSQRQIARSWFKTAIDKQQRPALLMPPVVLSPMEVRLAQYYYASGESQKVVESYQSAIRRRPNDLQSLRGYRNSLAAVGREEEAAQVETVISAVQQ